MLANFASLTALQAVNMLLPLITLPYLVRVLGAEKYGLINFALSIVMYFDIFVGFGFNLSATREVSVNRENKEKISEIFSVVIFLKLVLFFISVIILSSILFNVERFNEDISLYYLTFAIVFGHLLFPSWFFQGMERMKYITYISVTTKTIVTVLIFILIKSESDYKMVPILNSFGAFFSGIVGFFLVFKMFKIELRFPKKSALIHHFKDSYHFFLSRIANDGSRYYATTIIGLVFGNVVVGYYAMVEKLYFAFMSISGIVSQTIYPYMTRTKNLKFFKKLLISILIFSVCVLAPIIYFRETVLNLVFHVQSDDLSKIFLIVFSGSIFHITSALVGYPLLAAFGFIKYANNSLIFASFFYIFFITISAYFFRDIFLVASSLIVYAFIGLLFRVYFINKTGIFTKQTI